MPHRGLHPRRTGLGRRERIPLRPEPAHPDPRQSLPRLAFGTAGVEAGALRTHTG